MAVHELNGVIIRTLRMVLRQARFQTNGPPRLHRLRSNLYLARHLPLQRNRPCLPIRVQHPDARSEPDNLPRLSPRCWSPDPQRIRLNHSDIYPQKRLPFPSFHPIPTTHSVR